MVFRKVCKPIFSEVKKDEVREMLIASANYPYSLVSQEDNITGYSFAKVITPVGTTKRKRRLDNLTPDEKMLRKKLKNREAAQTSRDKKKAYITNLEMAIKQLREQNELLQKRVENLTNDKEVLQKKNERLEMMTGQVSVSSVNTPTEPAVLHSTTPLPWDLPVLHATVLSSLLLTFIPKNFFWIWTSLIGLIILQTHPILKSWKRLPIHYLKRLINWRRRCQRVKVWWGPRQKSWNPRMKCHQ